MSPWLLDVVKANVDYVRFTPDPGMIVEESVYKNPVHYNTLWRHDCLFDLAYPPTSVPILSVRRCAAERR